jgi:hypothetical protein
VGELPSCVYCGEPGEGYQITAGGGVAHEDPCTDEICRCGHGAEEHSGDGLACLDFDGEGEDTSRCECKAWAPFRIKFSDTQRGFAIGLFSDLYGAKCSVQDSSLATEAAIWLGMDQVDLKVFDPHNGGWRTVPDPPTPRDGSVLHSGRMHLTVPMAVALADVLDRFIEKGSIQPAEKGGPRG